MTKKYDSRADEEVDILQRLPTGSGVDHDVLAINVSVAGIERIQLAAAQRQCPELGPVYTAVLAKQTEGLHPRGELVALKKRQGDWFLHRKVDPTENQSVYFELVGGLLFRRVYDDVEGKVQLRCCIPTGA